MESPGRRVITGHRMGEIRVWDLSGDTPTHVAKSHTGTIKSLDVHPSNTRFVSAGLDGKIIVWHAERVEPIVVLDGHTDAVQTVSFSRDGSRILSVSADGTLRVWDARPSLAATGGAEGRTPAR